MQLAFTICRTAILGFAVLSSSLYAQHGAGHHSGVAGPGFAPGFQRGAVPPGPNLGGRPYPIRTDLPTPVGLNPSAASYTGISPGALKPINGNRGRGFFPGFVAPSVGWPSYWDLGLSSFGGYNDSIPPIDPNAQALAESQNALAQQLQQLTTEIQQMKSSGQQQPPSPAPTASAAPEHRPATPPITLVLRDGQQLSVQNYAVMNQTLWNFSKHPVQKIPVANIDIPASAKATEASGGEFPQITSPQ
ncbi:MAG: hypothetical protein ACJ73N_15200 [Bryobacteraceae bacterium]|jgi:hypothetical protein